MTSSSDISNSDDVIDIRDVIERIEELEAKRPGMTYDDMDELAALLALMSECRGNGGDEQWRGDWYPVTLVRDSYFKEYAQQLAEDCCPYPSNSPEAIALEQWPYRCIDWDQAAGELRMDYTAVEFDGVTYWARY